VFNFAVAIGFTRCQVTTVATGKPATRLSKNLGEVFWLNCGKVIFSRISLLLVPEPYVSILRITVCTILDNDGIPTSDDSGDLLDFSN